MPAVDVPHDMLDADGKWHGPGSFPAETLKYFDFQFKGQAVTNFPDTQFYVNPQLHEHLKANHPSLKVLNLSGRNLKDDQMTPIMQALRGNTTVTEIDLSRNNFDLAALELAEILKTNTTVKKLNLKNNDMHDKATIAISEMLMCNSTLTELDLTCTFAGKDTKYIAEALEARAARRTAPPRTPRCSCSTAPAALADEQVAHQADHGQLPDRRRGGDGAARRPVEEPRARVPRVQQLLPQEGAAHQAPRVQEVSPPPDGCARAHARQHSSTVEGCWLRRALLLECWARGTPVCTPVNCRAVHVMC
jgi:hypothetical protein